MERDNCEHGRQAVIESMETARELGWTWWVARSLTDLAVHALQTGDHEEAERCAREFLDISWGTDNKQEVLYGLAILARAAAIRGDADRALALWSSVQAVEDTPGRFGKFDREEYAAAMPHEPLPAPLPLAKAVALALAS